MGIVTYIAVQFRMIDIELTTFDHRCLRSAMKKDVKCLASPFMGAPDLLLHLVYIHFPIDSFALIVHSNIAIFLISNLT